MGAVREKFLVGRRPARSAATPLAKVGADDAGMSSDTGSVREALGGRDRQQHTVGAGDPALGRRRPRAAEALTESEGRRQDRGHSRLYGPDRAPPPRPDPPAGDPPHPGGQSTRPDYAIPSAPDHPPTLAVREERIVAALDTWLATLTDPADLDGTVAAIMEADQASRRREPPAVVRARRDARRLATELDRLLAAIRAGLDPVLAAGETRKVQAELALAEAVVRSWDADPDMARPLTHSQVLGALSAAGGIAGLLGNADRAQRARLYTELGVTLDYERETATERVHVRSQLSGGGGSRPSRTFGPQT
jgi:hypothetical protein